MFSRRVLKRRGFLDSESHQRITGFQRPPIRTSRCSMGQSLTIRLALISIPVTRYPFGSWYLCNGIRRIGSYIGGNEKRTEEQAPGAVRNCESRAVRGQEKLHHQDARGHPTPQKSLIAVSAAKSRTRCYRLTLWIWDGLLRFHDGWHGGFLTASWPETDSVGVFTSKEKQI